MENVPSNTVSLLPGLFAHPSGALWIPALRTALIADLHLGYSWAQRRRGELGPLADSAAQKKLASLIDALQPEQIVFLGDLVHAPRPCAPEREWIESILHDLALRSRLVIVRGNHDRAFAKDFAHLHLELLDSWSTPGLVALHGDRLALSPIPDDAVLVMGHLHPSLPLRDVTGASRRLPLFLASSCCIVLPAFSPFAGGFDVAGSLPAALEACFQNSEINLYATTGTRIAPLGPLQQALQQMFSSTPNTPGHFRRRKR